MNDYIDILINTPQHLAGILHVEVFLLRLLGRLSR